MWQPVSSDSIHGNRQLWLAFKLNHAPDNWKHLGSPDLEFFLSVAPRFEAELSSPLGICSKNIYL
jgi:hypothetical protein